MISPINKWVATVAREATHSREAVLSPLMTINVSRTISAHPLKCLTVDGLEVHRSPTFLWRLIQALRLFSSYSLTVLSSSKPAGRVQRSYVGDWKCVCMCVKWTNLNRFPLGWWHPGVSLGATLGVTGSEKSPVYSSTAARYTTSLSPSAPLWVTSLWTTTSHSPIAHPALWVCVWQGVEGVF